MLPDTPVRDPRGSPRKKERQDRGNEKQGAKREKQNGGSESLDPGSVRPRTFARNAIRTGQSKRRQILDLEPMVAAAARNKQYCAS